MLIWTLQHFPMLHSLSPKILGSNMQELFEQSYPVKVMEQMNADWQGKDDRDLFQILNL
ncbi:hypothetical protein NIES2135_36440 [Leptolyngbya boryana NIES-2135]|jgi:hypothetical protein|uniref:Uncharacterized protein n=1 Tax=Leptolyngbya boryana NIES-2135 TaxID=1973484 RepID=A0A1Z4JJB6_LEPBY|nr:hypothetical protein NIES2135_36440 [Leptolyngbya boryana NIES-2135]